LAEVASIATERGLHCRTSDSIDGTLLHRLIVADRPLTWEQIRDLRANDPHHSCWTGTIAVCSPLHVNVLDRDPKHTMIWGNMLLFGDRNIIRRLTGREL
jgi:hypothetical protein